MYYGHSAELRLDMSTRSHLFVQLIKGFRRELGAASVGRRICWTFIRGRQSLGANIRMPTSILSLLIKLTPCTVDWPVMELSGVKLLD